MDWCDESTVCTGRVGETRCVDGKLQRCLADWSIFCGDVWSTVECWRERDGGLAGFPLECVTGAEGVGFCREVGAAACSEPGIHRCDGVTITLCDSGFFWHIADCTSRDPDGVCMEIGDDQAICTYPGSSDCDPGTFGVNDGVACEGDWLIGCDVTRRRTVRRDYCKRDDPDGLCLQGDDWAICTYAGSSDCDPETFGVEVPFWDRPVRVACEDDWLITCHPTAHRTVRSTGVFRCPCSCAPDAPDPFDACLRDTSCYDETGDATDGPGT